METTANTAKLTPSTEGSFTELLSSAVEKLRDGVLEEAHKLLNRLMRKHNHDADVIFNLAVARKRLGYDVSAEALFAQAFDHGYTFPSGATQAIAERPGYFRWTDETGSVSIVVRERPRRASLLFVELESNKNDVPVQPDAD